MAETRTHADYDQTLAATIDAALAALRDGDPARARDLCATIEAHEPDHPMAAYVRGHAAWRVADPAGAVVQFRAALDRDPDFAEAHTDLGNVLWEAHQPAEAAAHYRAALALRPDFAEAHSNLGVALSDLGEYDAAIASYRRALARAPAHATAHYNLCGLLEKTHRIGELRAAVAAARQACPGDPRVALRAAQLARRDGALEDARAILETADPPAGDLAFQAERAQLLGELCDRLGDTDAAFAWFDESNRCERIAPAAKRADPGRYRAQVTRLTRRFTADWVAAWRPLPAPEPASHMRAFLVGFPRSGTTLLDSILRSHPDVAVVEEQPAVDAMIGALGGGHPDALATLTAAGADRLRAAYDAELARHLPDGEAPGLVVDKRPLNLVEAGLIQRVFPDARFLFALRHPCDAVLSAYMQQFRMNDAMANFLRLRDAAKLYDGVMRLWLQYRAVLPLSVHTVRYEDLTADFAGTLAPLLGFLGVAWDDALYAYAETARRRAKINTPSYDQVTEPIHTRASGRWTAYRDHMEPVLPTLRPWAERFGYGIDEPGT